MLIKKIIISVLLLIFFSFSALSAPYPDVSGKSAVLINSDTKEVIFEKNPYKFLSMASTTKIMTSILAVESGKLSCFVTADKDYDCEGTAVGIKKGNCFTLETLVYAMLLESGNDAAALTADFLAGSETAFAEKMNKKAKEIGMESTNFVTASGLDAQNHGSTAYDMALLGAYAVKNPIFRRICSTKQYTAQYISPDISATYSNHNRLLGSYDGVFGIKTGFTKKSGRCLVTACERDGVTLVAVTLNDGDDWNDHKKLYDYGFSTLTKKYVNPGIPDSIEVFGGERKNLKIKTDFGLCNINSNQNVSYKIKLRKWIYAPINIDDIVGNVEIYVNNQIIGTAEITAAESTDVLMIGEKKPRFNFFYKLKRIIFN